MTVITGEGMGEIGFNLGGVWFEFFLGRAAFADADIDALIHHYKVDIYDESSTTDFYSEGSSAQEVMRIRTPLDHIYIISCL